MSGNAVLTADSKAAKYKKKLETFLQEEFYDTLVDPNKIPNKSCGDLSREKENDKGFYSSMRMYNDGFERRNKKLWSIFSNISQNQELESHPDSLKLYDSLARNLATFIDEIKAALVKVNLHDKGFVPGYLVGAVGLQCLGSQSCSRLITDSSLRKQVLEKWALQLTEYIRLMLLIECDCHHILGLLLNRAQAFFYMKRLSKARRDLQALHWSRHWFDFQPEIVKCMVTYCLQIKCLLKMRRQQGLRPLFTPQEREDLENKLKIGVYDETVFQCGGCGKKDLEAGTYALLRKCEGCLKKWYCSKECQRNAWLLGHSTECKNTRASFDFNQFKSEGVMLSTAAAISLYNISVVESDDNQPMVIMYDEHCGMFFECLSDASMPAETSNAIVAKMEIMQENGGVSLNHLLDHSRQAAEETSRKPAISGEDVTKEESGS